MPWPFSSPKPPTPAPPDVAPALNNDVAPVACKKCGDLACDGRCFTFQDVIPSPGADSVRSLSNEKERKQVDDRINAIAVLLCDGDIENRDPRTTYYLEQCIANSESKCVRIQEDCKSKLHKVRAMSADAKNQLPLSRELDSLLKVRGMMNGLFSNRKRKRCGGEGATQPMTKSMVGGQYDVGSC